MRYLVTNDMETDRVWWGLKKVKVKVRSRTGHEGPEKEYRYSSTLSLTSALDGVGGQHHASAALAPRKTRYPLYRRLGGLRGRSGRVRKISPTGIRSPNRPAHSDSLYWLSYLDPQDFIRVYIYNAFWGNIQANLSDCQRAGQGYIPRQSTLDIWTHFIVGKVILWILRFSLISNYSAIVP